MRFSTYFRHLLRGLESPQEGPDASCNRGDNLVGSSACALMPAGNLWKQPSTTCIRDVCECNESTLIDCVCAVIEIMINIVHAIRSVRSFVLSIRISSHLLLLGHIKNNPARNLSVHHPIVHVLQISNRLANKVNLDKAAGGNIKRLRSVLAVANVRAEDVDALEDGEEDRRVEGRATGETDTHEVTAGTEVFDGLLVATGLIDTAY